MLPLPSSQLTFCLLLVSSLFLGGCGGQGEENSPTASEPQLLDQGQIDRTPVAETSSSSLDVPESSASSVSFSAASQTAKSLDTQPLIDNQAAQSSTPAPAALPVITPTTGSLNHKGSGATNSTASAETRIKSLSSARSLSSAKASKASSSLKTSSSATSLRSSTSSQTSSIKSTASSKPAQSSSSAKSSSSKPSSKSSISSTSSRTSSISSAKSSASAPSSRSSSSAKSNVTSSSSSSKAASSASGLLSKVARLQWTPPKMRANGTYLELEEIGGYQIRYMPLLGDDYVYINLQGNEITELSLKNLPIGAYFEIAVFDTNGLYSDFVPINPLQ